MASSDRPLREGSQLDITCLGKGSGVPDKVVEIRGLLKSKHLKKKQALQFSSGRISLFASGVPRTIVRTLSVG